MQKKVLVVDDDQSIREIIIFILQGEGFDVLGLENGSAVVNTVQATQPDVVLLDVQLGDSDGRDICRELKLLNTTHDIPVIMISANSSWQGLKDKECEPDDFLPKPFDISDLINHVRRFAA